MENKFFMHHIRSKDGTVTNKGIDACDTYDEAKGSYHAYFGAYAYERGTDDFVSCLITDMTGTVLMKETWIKATEETDPEE